MRAPGLRAGGMFGFDAFFVDQVTDDTGVGFYAPMAGARVTSTSAAGPQAPMPG